MNVFNISFNNLKGMITYFKDKNNKSKKNFEKYKTLTTVIISFETFVIIATISCSINLSLTGTGLIVMPRATPSTCSFSVGNKVKY